LLKDLTANKFQIKTSKEISKNPQDNGKVMFRRQDACNPKELKPYHSIVQDISDEASYIAGSIHIRKGILKHSSWGVLVLIHEATHKYAGTVDHAYYTYQSCGEDLDGDMTNLKALSNADSYAWFIMNVGNNCFDKPYLHTSFQSYPIPKTGCSIM
jgi:hypothetical protein